MPKVTYDFDLRCAVTIDVDNPENGRRWLRMELQTADINLGLTPDGEAMVGEATMNGEATIGLVDGEEPEDDRYKPGGIYAPPTEQERVDAIYANAATDIEKRMEPYRPVDIEGDEPDEDRAGWYPNANSAFDQFKASRRRSEAICAEFGFDDGLPERGGYIYDGGYIEDNTAVGDDYVQKPGKFYMVIERMDWASDDLEEMEKILWAMHAVFERDDAATFKLAGADLDAFIQGYCAANNIRVDGDVFGMVFSGAAATPTPRIARELIDRAARLYSLYKTPAGGAEAP